MPNKQFIFTVLGGGPGYTLEDTDLWGLQCALQHALDDGYFQENEFWALQMQEKIITLRGTADPVD